MARNKCQDCDHLCCDYITVKIPAPRTIIDFDGLIWQVSHDHIEAFRDHTGWHLLVYGKCCHLEKDGKCTIYEERPITCRQHPVENCEYKNPLANSFLQHFRNFQELDEYCCKRFKTWKKRF